MNLSGGNGTYASIAANGLAGWLVAVIFASIIQGPSTFLSETIFVRQNNQTHCRLVMSFGPRNATPQSYHVQIIGPPRSRCGHPRVCCVPRAPRGTSNTGSQQNSNSEISFTWCATNSESYESRAGCTPLTNPSTTAAAPALQGLELFCHPQLRKMHVRASLLSLGCSPPLSWPPPPLLRSSS